MQARTGIDLFSVERDLYFGTPPQDVLVLAGNFDAAAIAQAYQKRAYTKNDLKGLTMWCGPAGCDQGQKLDVKAVDPSDPFGGQLGRQQPVVVAPGYVLSSPNLQVLADAASAYQTGSSLAKAPDYLALAESVTQSGTLLQATFVPAKLVPDSSSIVSALGKNLSPQVLEALRKKWGDSLSSTLPPYTLAGIAHTVDGDNVIAYVALVYDKEEDAKVAAAEFPTLFAQCPSIAVQGKDFADILKDRNITLDPARIYASQTTGKFVMLLPLRSPIESAEPVNGQLPPSGVAYRVLFTSLLRRDILWLTPKAAPK
jgi:hypothetical protein